MTALSKESEISRIERIPTIASPCHPQRTPAKARPTTVTAKDQPKVFRSTSYPFPRCVGSPAHGWTALYETLTPDSTAPGLRPEGAAPARPENRRPGTPSGQFRTFTPSKTTKKGEM
ncbi:hypothetical protein GCM10010361_21870 [Streptomyces olivaceiscleroticus]|uniref:Uncharacterized protein n=1 Tax=Streptomyces olivaceiscleroticus TaxID=68245 RepID=A0ABP3JNQ7_9ACTN